MAGAANATTVAATNRVLRFIFGLLGDFAEELQLCPRRKSNAEKEAGATPPPFAFCNVQDVISFPIGTLAKVRRTPALLAPADSPMMGLVAVHLAKFSHGQGRQYCGGRPNRRHIEAFITESKLSCRRAENGLRRGNSPGGGKEKLT